MGELVAFELPKRGRRANRPAEFGAVILFTGVRRELIADSGTPRRETAKAAGPKRGKSQPAALDDAL